MIMKANPLLKMSEFGQSIWFDDTRRDLIAGGELRRMIQEDGLRGTTSNPSIFEKAIVGSQIYQDDIVALASKGQSPKLIYESLIGTDTINTVKRTYFVESCTKLGLKPASSTTFDWLEADDRASFLK